MMNPNVAILEFRAGPGGDDARLTLNESASLETTYTLLNTLALQVSRFAGFNRVKKM